MADIKLDDRIFFMETQAVSVSLSRKRKMKQIELIKFLLNQMMTSCLNGKVEGSQNSQWLIICREAISLANVHCS